MSQSLTQSSTRNAGKVTFPLILALTILWLWLSLAENEEVVEPVLPEYTYLNFANEGGTPELSNKLVLFSSQDGVEFQVPQILQTRPELVAGSIDGLYAMRNENHNAVTGLNSAVAEIAWDAESGNIVLWAYDKYSGQLLEFAIPFDQITDPAIAFKNADYASGLYLSTISEDAEQMTILLQSTPFQAEQNNILVLLYIDKVSGEMSFVDVIRELELQNGWETILRQTSISITYADSAKIMSLELRMGLSSRYNAPQPALSVLLDYSDLANGRISSQRAEGMIAIRNSLGEHALMVLSEGRYAERVSYIEYPSGNLIGALDAQAYWIPDLGFDLNLLPRGGDEMREVQMIDAGEGRIVYIFTRNYNYEEAAEGPHTLFNLLVAVSDGEGHIVREEVVLPLPVSMNIFVYNRRDIAEGIIGFVVMPNRISSAIETGPDYTFDVSGLTLEEIMDRSVEIIHNATDQYFEGEICNTLGRLSEKTDADRLIDICPAR